MLGGDGRRHELSQVLAEEFAAIITDPTAVDVYGIDAPLDDALKTAVDEARMLERRPQRQADAVEKSRRRLLYKAAHGFDLSALCLSGGGIRSATISLGVIQGLVDAELLKKVNYLSTVSGGGYIGSWLSAWLHYTRNADAVLARLGSQRNNPDWETPPLAHLRSYSNFLTPKLGLFSADTWAAAAIVFRNIVVNWLILLPALALLVIGIKLTALGLTALAPDPNACSTAVAAFVCMLAGGMAFGYKLGRLYAPPDIDLNRDGKKRNSTAQRCFLCWSLAPAMVAGMCFTWLALRHQPPSGSLLPLPMPAATPPSRLPPPPDLSFASFRRMLLFAGIVYLVALAIGFLWATPNWCKEAFGRNRQFAIRGKDFMCWIVGLLVFATMNWLGAHYIAGLGESVTWVTQICVKSTTACIPDAQPHPVAITIGHETLVVIFGLPWFLLSTLLAHTTYLLLRSAAREGEIEREWLGRASGWHFIAGLAWIMISSVVLIGPWVFYHAAITANVLTVVSGAVTGLLGKSGLTPATGVATDWSGFGANLALAVAGPAFAVLLLTLLSVAIDWSVIGSTEQCFPPNEAWAGCIEGRWWLPIVVAVGVLLVANWAANVNAFSLHAVYRNRLIRAFLGGGRSPHREPDGFTDFDWDDDLRVASLWDPQKRPEGINWRPFHVINTTLNLAETNRLAWQQRKAMSFSISPFFCGNANLGYRATDCYGGPPTTPRYGERAPMSGISLGTAMAISGSAVSSNMGYHSSMSLSFLLTFFNVRLGVWLGNPQWCGPDEPYRRAGPRFAVWPLLSELFGLTTANRRYVNLSDGGHFEDFGLYEMVRRRCKWIVLVDGGEDAERGFEDLGNAVRKIWIDLGVRISFANSPLLAATNEAKSAAIPYFAVGTITYVSDTSCGTSASPPEGKILYLKPVVRGDEAAADVIAYKRANSGFPDQPATDQWFDESQFESYRRLGQLMVERIVEAATRKQAPADFGTLFDGLDGVDPSNVPPQPKAPAGTAVETDT